MDAGIAKVGPFLSSCGMTGEVFSQRSQKVSPAPAYARHLRKTWEKGIFYGAVMDVKGGERIIQRVSMEKMETW